CSAAVNFTASASDNCDNSAVLVCIPASGSSFPVGLSVVTCRATDSSGNSVTNSFTITVTDLEAPRLTCPETIMRNTEPGTNSAIVTYAVAANDNCGLPTVVSSPASGSRFPIGTNVVTSTATDASGNKTTCTFLVIIV